MDRSDGDAQWQPPLPKESTPDLIMTLPRELRIVIYELVLVAPDSIRACPTNKPQCVTHIRGLLSTSKQIRAEAKPIFCNQTRFRICLHRFDPCDFELFGNWLRKVITNGGIAPFEKTEWDLSGLSLLGDGRNISAKILAASTFAQTIRELGVDLAENTLCGLRSSPRVIRITGATTKKEKHTIALMQVFKLGKAAHDEGWSAEVLESELRVLSRWWLGSD